MAATEDEVDFEVDPEDLDGAPVRQTDSTEMSLLVDDLHVTYRVFGAKKVGHGPARKQNIFQRFLSRGEKESAVREVHAVRGISFTAMHGESIGIIGINGSGKSTLLRAIAGLIPAESGSVYVAGDPALLGVNAVLMAEMSGERNIMIGGLALGLTEDEVNERFDDIVDFAEIGEFVNLPMKSYSSGMGARLRFAISASATPDILMIDEALATGDATFRAKSKARIDEVRESAGTVFLVSHSLATVQSMCSRVLWVHEGKLVMDGPAEDVCEEYKQFVAARKKAVQGNKKKPAKKKPAGKKPAGKKPAAKDENAAGKKPAAKDETPAEKKPAAKESAPAETPKEQAAAPEKAQSEVPSVSQHIVAPAAQPARAAAAPGSHTSAGSASDPSPSAGSASAPRSSAGSAPSPSAPAVSSPSPASSVPPAQSSEPSVARRKRKPGAHVRRASFAGGTPTEEDGPAVAGAPGGRHRKAD
jgi:teichoic acid transport system ATP-binding protein